jgi:ERCC4-related helicase
LSSTLAGADQGPGRGIAPGAQIVVRDELWLVRKTRQTARDGLRIEATGVSDFVRDSEAVFFTSLDRIEPLDPRATRLVPDTSSEHRLARLYLEAVIRKSFLPQLERGLALADTFLLDTQAHQQRPAELALSMRNPQPRLLIADVVGLGKTLEIGILLAELIRRGRGERILVVTPQHVLEQFQRELWTRFAIPLVRLDSTGIGRVARQIPAGRNPFAYFKRVIVSVDTLKNRDLYRHHLDATMWDAVVIDESHNLINRGSQRNDLARSLARRTDALILASATPHNGDPESFAELVRMLDPAAITNPKEYRATDLEHLFIRRTKVSPEVRDSLKGVWADRGPSEPVTVTATSKEEEVFKLLAEQWITGDRPSAAQEGFTAFTLLKSFLSSHKALLQTVGTRTTTLTKTLAKKLGDPAAQRELAALADLRTAAEKIRDEDSSKLDALVTQLEALKVRPGSDVRVVVFSERIETLEWLKATVPARLGFSTAQAKDAVAVWHSKSLSDQEQMRVIERFGLREDPLRLLLTGDAASEGVNLHHQCHQMIHFDLPWSLIRIEQRNGRIDRYGQAHSPEFRALVLTSTARRQLPAALLTTGPEDERCYLDDRLVGAKLLRREEQAHKIEGTAEAVTGLFQADQEDQRLTRDLILGRGVEESIKAAHDEQAGGGVLGDLLGTIGAVPARAEIARAQVPKLFKDTAGYVTTALATVVDANELELLEKADTISLRPPADLQYRLRALPDSYLKERHILSTDEEDKDARMVLTFHKKVAQDSLKAALDSADTQWPQVSFLTDIHPFLDWITDKALVRLGRHEAFVLHAKVDEPVFLVQGTYANRLGRPTVVEWMAVSGLPQTPKVTPMQETLAAAGVGPSMDGLVVGEQAISRLQGLVPTAIDAATQYFETKRAEYEVQIAAPLEDYRKRLRMWKQDALPLARTGAQTKRVNDAALERGILVDSLETSGEPMLRLLAVLTGGE